MPDRARILMGWSMQQGLKKPVSRSIRRKLLMWQTPRA